MLAIALPEAEVALVESVGKKCAWMEATVEALGLDERAGRLRARGGVGDGRGAFDVVTARALGALAVVCEYAAPLLREGGLLVAWKGAVDEAEEADGLAAAAALGLERDAVLRGRSRTRAPSGARCTSSARSRPRRSAIRGAREWPQNAR